MISGEQVGFIHNSHSPLTIHALHYFAVMNVIIRRAVKEDCTRILQLVKELATYERAPNEVTVTLEHFEESGFGEKPVWWAFVAELDGRVEGFALWYIRFSTWKGQRMY